MSKRKNSRPWLDEALRETYRQENPFDETAKYFPEWDRGWTTVPGTPVTHIRALDTPRDHVHHIAHGHGGNRRWDRTWNLISLSWYTHLFVHALPVDGLSICLKAKIDKGDWDATAARETLGLNLIGYLYGKSCEFDFAEEIRRNLIDASEAA